jgi:hypothetical protein
MGIIDMNFKICLPLFSSLIIRFLNGSNERIFNSKFIVFYFICSCWLFFFFTEIKTTNNNLMIIYGALGNIIVFCIFFSNFIQNVNLIDDISLYPFIYL